MSEETRANVLLHKEYKEVWNRWRLSSIVNIYKRKGSRSDWKYYRGISLLNIPGKVQVRIIILACTKS